LDRRARWHRMAVELHPDIDVLEILVDVGDIGVSPHQVAEACAGSFQSGLYILQCLPELGTHVPRADNLASFVTGKLAGYEDKPPRLDADDMGVQDKVVYPALVQRFWLDVAAIDRHVTSTPGSKHYWFGRKS